MTDHRACLEALSAAMALPPPPSRVRLLRGPVEVLDDDCEYEVVRVVEWECSDEDVLDEPQGPPREIQRDPCARCAQGVMDGDRVVGGVTIPGNDHLYGRCGCSCHPAPRRQQGRIQDYGRRAG